MLRQIDVERSLRSSGDTLEGQRSGAKRLFLACALNFLVLSSGIFVVKSMLARHLLCQTALTNVPHSLQPRILLNPRILFSP